MSTHNESHQIKVIKFVQELLLDEENRVAITPALIDEKIEMVLKMNPKWGVELNKQTVIDELIRRFSLWIGHDTTLKNEIGHVHWLVSARKKDWRYWQRYREWQERKLSATVVDKLDQSTDTVLSLLEDPLRDGPWDRRGLVVGHVQSGKTGHYTGLICKAADAGYKIIIVLAGMHNNLRSQTQVRLDEGFLGYETKPIVENIRIIGVGEIDGDPAIRPNFATNRSDKGDFSTAAAKNLGITPEQRPWLFVVKKNKTVLERLLRWIRNHVANAVDEHGNKIVTNLPLLIIDDEADHASVDTGEQVFDSEGKPDEEHQPTAINRLIRRILNSYTRAAYVGYTATPFANIFIHERGATREDGPDLFPSSFIVNLAAPSNYVGPARVFGLGEEGDKGLPLIRLIADHSDAEGRGGWMPQKHRNGHVPLHDGLDAMPPSLQEAIQAFILACSIRYLRGQQNEHSSMLVHVTRFNSVQHSVNRQVDEYVRHLRQRITRGIGSEEALRGLSDLYERDFMPTSSIISKELPDAVPIINPTWDEIIEILPDVLSDIQVRMINGTAKDALDYSEHEGAGLKVIAIGGDKLARGLTLEGLCVSYFLRASKMYDTLMQMGRWFGYRPGYLDMCRLYTTSELAEWFGHIAEAAEELREEFDLMAASGSTPREYGLKVQSHPVLMVTSRLKMRSARNLMLSFSGDLLETIAFFRDSDVLEKNLSTTQRLISTLGTPSEVDPKRIRNGSKQEWKGCIWNDVPANDVMDFLQSYKTHPDVHKVNSPLLAEFIRSMNSEGELTKWMVVLVGSSRDEGGPIDFGNGVKLENMITRSVKGAYEPTRYSIGRLMSSRDEAIDLDEPAWNAALALTRKAWHADPARRQRSKEEPDVPNGPAVRRIRGFGDDNVQAHPERGVLFIYPIDAMKSEAAFDRPTPPVIAFAISFPGSNSGLKVEYKVNNVLWEQEYGSAE
jgi:Z1 domain